MSNNKGKVAAVLPTGRTIARFTVIENFTCEATKSEYMKGLTYDIREGNNALMERVEKWKAENKVY